MRKHFVTAKQARKWGWIEPRPSFWQRLRQKLRKNQKSVSGIRHKQDGSMS